MIDRLYNSLLSEETRKKSERFIITIAIASFVLHLILIGIKDLGLLSVGAEAELLTSPIAAIYTPFSFILLYEVYLLVFYLPKSITLYISKQYEIITLVVIRRIFKDLANLHLESDWFSDRYDLQFTFDIITTPVLFGLILLFYRLNKRAGQWKVKSDGLSAGLKRFINRKKILAICLVPVFLILAFYSLGSWLYEYTVERAVATESIRDINEVFFNEFFTVLILADVLLLLFSLSQTDEFSKVIRNSGFIISTILIRLSFGVKGFTNNILIVAAVIFGVLILYLHNGYLRLQHQAQ